MNAADYVGFSPDLPITSDITPKRRKRPKSDTISDKFDAILEKCPRSNKVRRFICEWLEQIEDDTMQKNYDTLF